MNREQILAILYEMAMVTSGEVRSAPLIRKSLQRFIHHTSATCGMYITLVYERIPGLQKRNEVNGVVDMVLGSPQMACLINQEVTLPANVVHDPGVSEIDDMTRGVLSLDNRYRYMLKLPASEGGVFLLLFNYEPKRDLPFADVFEPVLKNFSHNLQLCRANEKFTEGLEREVKMHVEKFAYIAAHDLKEPLRMISSYLNLIEDRYAKSLDGDGIEFINYAVTGATRLEKLINDLMEYSVITNKVKIAEQVDCNVILSEVIEELQEEYCLDEVNIRSADLPVLKYDRTGMKQVFKNLVANSVKYRKESDAELIISCSKFEGSDFFVETDDMESGWLFSFKDNGIGFKQEYAEKIFEIFKRLHGSDQYTGTGIGLAICKRIITDNGGNIWATSMPGDGATFYFTCRD